MSNRKQALVFTGVVIIPRHTYACVCVFCFHTSIDLCDYLHNPDLDLSIIIQFSVLSF